MENLDGTFKVKLLDEERTLKCDFGTIETLERHVFGRPIIAAVTDAINGNVFIGDVVSVLHEGLKANRDTRLKREEIGHAVLHGGVANFIPVYLEYLQYAITGSSDLEIDFEPDSKKK